jgi:uncharacterized membrane protein
MPKFMKIAIMHLGAALVGYVPIAFLTTNFIESERLRITLSVLPFIAAIFTASDAGYRAGMTTAGPADDIHNPTPGA